MVNRRTKADCSPEEWAAYLAYHREYRQKNNEKVRAQRREYSKRQDVKEKRRARDADPSRAAKRREYAQTESAKLRAKELYNAKKSTPEKWAKRLASQRERRTGFTQELASKLFALQGGACAICGKPFDKEKKIASDHCHQSGKPRGLLCHYCNTMEGMLKKLNISPSEFAKRLEHYLLHPPASGLSQA